MKNWTGNKNSIFKTHGASNHTTGEREENDYYATDPKAVKKLLQVEKFQKDILEPACGEGHISKVLIASGYNVKSSDLIDRGYGTPGDFMSIKSWHGDIVTNPPYKFAQEFVQHSLDITQPGAKIAMLLKLTFLEGKKRYSLFTDYPPYVLHVFSRRVSCAKNGDFSNAQGAVAYGWYVWINGNKADTKVRWLY